LVSGHFQTPEALRFLAFFAGGRRGVIRPRRSQDEDIDSAD